MTERRIQIAAAVVVFGGFVAVAVFAEDLGEALAGMFITIIAWARPGYGSHMRTYRIRG